VRGDAADGLLLIHAFPLDAQMWTPQVRALGDRVPVVAPSLPGSGGTPLVGSTTSMGVAAAWCLQAIDAVGLERPVVCGLSMGGYVAFELWRMARQRIGGLVLANTRSGADTPEAAAGRRALAERLREEGIGFLAAGPPPLLGPTAPQVLRDEVRNMIAGQSAEGIAAAAEGMAERRDSTPDLSAIDVPALVITSDHDVLIPPEMTTPMATSIPGAELLTLEGVGHLSSLEAPEAFTEALMRFLERCGITGLG
jgi:3-oxoadipate enol-lactonase